MFTHQVGADQKNPCTYTSSILRAVNRTRDLHRTKEPSTFRRVYRHPRPMSRRLFLALGGVGFLEPFCHPFLFRVAARCTPQTGFSCRLGIFRAMAIELKIMRYFLIRQNDSVLLILGSLKYS